MINLLNEHYSFNNPASVYDEEALTALELAGRTTKKLNEVIQSQNGVIKDVEHEKNVVIPERIADEMQNRIDDGTFDKKIDKYAGSLEARLNNLTENTEEGSTTLDVEVIDIRTRADRQIESSAGNAVRTQFKVLAERFSESEKQSPIYIDDFISGEAYSTTNGTTGTNAEFSRSTYLVPCKEHVLFSCPEFASDCQVIVICFGKNFEYLGKAYCTNSNNPRIPNCTVTGTKYIGITVKNPSISAVHLNPLSFDGNMIDYPFNGKDKNYLFFSGYWCNGYGGIAAAENFNTVVVPLTNAMKTFVSVTTQFNSHFFDGNNTMITANEVATSEIDGINGRVYNVPENAVYCCFNLSAKNYVAGDTSRLARYATIIHKESPNRLNNKKVLCVGDSVTWLDGRYGNYDDSDPFIGYQKQLRGYGAIVDTAGFSGYPYTVNTLTATNSDSIFKQIVANVYDVSGYDMIVLMGGANDVLYDMPLGTEPSFYDYENDSVYDGLTFYNAVGGIIDFIRDNNPTAEIYLCTTLPAQSANRKYAENKPYRDALIKCSEFYSVPCIDLFTLINATPALNFSSFFYDTVHPNIEGMVRLGQIVANKIERYGV